ncbi:MAG: site-specific integrase, partial [Deltaproteobacteria bacterium]|nr:site-specific integrase [Deltaproteobacteria bacterium]
MKVSQAVAFWLNYHRANSSKNTIRAYKELMERFCQENGDKDLKELTSDDVLDFLNGITEGKKSQTRKTRFSHLTSFFNFTKNNIDQSFQNPCDIPIIKKMFRARALAAWDILEKKIVDEIIFKTDNPRDRLMLELMARGGMRIGEVLKLTPRDVYGRKLIIRDPKSGKEKEFIFIPQKIADRLKDYIRENGIRAEDHIFPICYETARSMAKKAGDVVGIHLRPHDLRRHAATFA